MNYKNPVRYINKGNESAANANQAAQASFYNTLTSSYAASYGQWTALTNSLNQSIQPIIAAGPGQYGFSVGENAALNANVIGNATTAYQNQQVAQNNQITAQSGGTALPSGAQLQLQQQSQLGQAKAISGAENAITQAGYAQGHANYQTALGQEQNLINAYNPNSFASAATGGGSASPGAVNAATSANTAAMAPITSLIGSAIGGATSALTGGMSSLGGGGGGSYNPYNDTNSSLFGAGGMNDAGIMNSA